MADYVPDTQYQKTYLSLHVFLIIILFSQFIKLFLLLFFQKHLTIYDVHLDERLNVPFPDNVTVSAWYNQLGKKDKKIIPEK